MQPLGSAGYAEEAASLVVASLALPPPVTGQTLVNARIASLLTQSPGKVRLINTSPKAHRRTILYHLRRMVAVLATLFVLATHAHHRRRCLYTVVDAGHGMPYNFLIVSVARLFGYRVFLHHHAASYAKRHDARFALLCAIAGKRATHIALSEAMAQDLKALYGFCRQTAVAHNASHIPDPGERKLARREGQLTIGFLSNLWFEKGLDTVLQTYEAIRARGLNARLVIAGPIVDDFAQELIDESRQKFGDAIVSLGPVSGASKQAFFEDIDVFLFPSRYRYEAQPLVVLEALSYGIPALVSRQGYSAEIVEPLGTAASADTFVEFATSFAEAWMKDPLFKDPLFATAQQHAARARFLELAEISRRQTSQLLLLLKGTQTTRTLIFVSSHRRHIRVADRLVGALAAHRQIELFSFDRGIVDHPVYADKNVSHTSLGHIPNGIAVLRLFALARAIWILSRAKRRIGSSDTILLVNTLELLVISWLCGLTRLPTVYDVADIHPLQISKSPIGTIARWLERSLLRHVNLLVVTSPWFYWVYFARWLGVKEPALLIENKVGFGAAIADPRRVLTHRIAWNGLLRCKTSAIVLLQCLQDAHPALQLSLHGTLDRLADIGPRLLAQPNCSYTGQYEHELLGALLASSSFVWAVDFADGENSKWLLPNRLYEAVAAGIPVIAVDGTATGEVVRHRNIGIVLPECTPQAVIHALKNCTAQTYASWLANVSALKARAIRRKEWTQVFDDVSRWGELKRLPNEIDVGIVLRADADPPSSIRVAPLQSSLGPQLA